VDLNRLHLDSAAQEAAALMRLAPLHGQSVAHIDLHETTDTTSPDAPPVAAR
jgi:hypothetical protein